MNDKQLYEAVPVTDDMPLTDFETVMVLPLKALAIFKDGQFFVKNVKYTPTHYMRFEPTDLSALIREVGEKAWEAGKDFEWASEYGPIPNPYPDKETYLKSI